MKENIFKCTVYGFMRDVEILTMHNSWNQMRCTEECGYLEPSVTALTVEFYKYYTGLNTSTMQSLRLHLVNDINYSRVVLQGTEPHFCTLKEWRKPEGRGCHTEHSVLSSVSTSLFFNFSSVPSHRFSPKSLSAIYSGFHFPLEPSFHFPFELTH